MEKISRKNTFWQYAVLVCGLLALACLPVYAFSALAGWVALLVMSVVLFAAVAKSQKVYKEYLSFLNGEKNDQA